MSSQTNNQKPKPDEYVLCDHLVWKYVKYSSGNLVQQWDAVPDEGAFTKLQLTLSARGRNPREREDLIREITKVGSIDTDKEIFTKVAGKDPKQFLTEQLDGSIIKVVGVKVEIESLRKKLGDHTKKPNEDKKENSKDRINKMQQQSGPSILCDTLIWDYLAAKFENEDSFSNIAETTEIKQRGDFTEIIFKCSNKSGSTSDDTAKLKESAMILIQQTKSQIGKHSMDKKLFEIVSKDVRNKFITKTSTNGSLLMVVGKTNDINELKAMTNSTIQCKSLIWLYVETFDIHLLDKIQETCNVIIPDPNLRAEKTQFDIELDKTNSASKPIKAKQELQKILDLAEKEITILKVSKEDFDIIKGNEKLKGKGNIKVVMQDKPVWRNNEKVYEVAGKLRYSELKAMIDNVKENTVEKRSTGEKSNSGQDAGHKEQQNKRNAANITQSTHKRAGIPDSMRNAQLDKRYEQADAYNKELPGKGQIPDENAGKAKNQKGKASSPSAAPSDITDNNEMADGQEKHKLTSQVRATHAPSTAKNMDQNPYKQLPKNGNGQSLSNQPGSSKNDTQKMNEQQVSSTIVKTSALPTKATDNKTVDNTSIGNKNIAIKGKAAEFTPNKDPKVKDASKIDSSGNSQPQAGVQDNSKDGTRKDTLTVHKAKVSDKGSINNEPKAAAPDANLKQQNQSGHHTKNQTPKGTTGPKVETKHPKQNDDKPKASTTSNKATKEKELKETAL